MDAQQQRLLFLRPSPEAKRSVRVPMATLLRLQRLTIRTDLQDSHLYVLSRDVVLPLLAAKPSLANIKHVRAPPHFVDVDTYLSGRHQQAPSSLQPLRQHAIANTCTCMSCMRS